MGGLPQGVGPSFGHDPDTSITSVTGAGTPHVVFAAAPELQRGDVLGGRFQIEAVIGSGGSGRVLRAFDRESRMLVALKILRPEFAEDPVWAERFSRELRVGRTITHPNVCRVFDIGDADGHKFLSMELAAGGCIRADVPKAVVPGAEKPIRAWDQRVADAKAVVAGIAALHAAGIVHRDIKPENILRMEDGRLVVTDFGLATDPGSGPGNTVMVGTPSYMAPEVVMGEPATLRADVWGIGVVLHEILFGGRPQWKAAGRGYRRFVLPPVTTPAERAVAELIGRCVNDVVETRPASAIDLQGALDVALRGKRTLSRRHRRQIGWGAVAVAALSALGMVRDRWTNSAQASSSQGAAPLAERVLTPTGTPEDWSKGATTLATFAGRLHCYSLIDGGKKVRAIWGTPRKAEDVDVKTGARTPSDLLPETYQDGCPVVSPDGRSLLYENVVEKGKHIFLSRFADGSEAREVVRGGSPEWLPAGDEFAFLLDSRHAATFSIPIGEMSVVPDDGAESRQLIEMAVDPKGTRMALRYLTEKLENVVVIHSIPSLAVVGRIALPQSAARPTFAGGSRLLFAWDGGGNAGELALVDWQTGTVQRMAALSDSIALRAYSVDDAVVTLARTERDNLWEQRPSGRVALTSDGNSFYGSMGKNGALAIQRRLRDGRFVVVLRDVEGGEKQITQGPADFTPSFLPDGKGVVFADGNSGRIMVCREPGSGCTAAHHDALMPGFPSVDPTGHSVAYLTMLNASRLRVVSLDGGEFRDLGPVGEACPVIWASASRLWAVGSVNGSITTWVEVDTNTGKRTGETRTKLTATDSGKCLPPSDLSTAVDSRRQVVLVAEDVTHLERLSGRRTNEVFFAR